MSDGKGALDQLRERPPRVEAGPAPTLFAAAAGVTGGGWGVPDEWMAEIRAALAPSDVAVLAPLAEGPCPDVPALVDPATPASLPEAFEWLATLPEEALLGELEGGAPLSPRWTWSRGGRAAGWCSTRGR